MNSNSNVIKWLYFIVPVDVGELQRWWGGSHRTVIRILTLEQQVEKQQNKTKQFCWQVSLGLIAAHVFSFWSLNYLSFEIIFNFKFYFGNEVTYRSHVLISTKKVTCK